MRAKKERRRRRRGRENVRRTFAVRGREQNLFLPLFSFPFDLICRIFPSFPLLPLLLRLFFDSQFFLSVFFFLVCRRWPSSLHPLLTVCPREGATKAERLFPRPSQSREGDLFGLRTVTHSRVSCRPSSTRSLNLWHGRPASTCATFSLDQCVCEYQQTLTSAGNLCGSP